MIRRVSLAFLIPSLEFTSAALKTTWVFPSQGRIGPQCDQSSMSCAGGRPDGDRVDCRWIGPHVEQFRVSTAIDDRGIGGDCVSTIRRQEGRSRDFQDKSVAFADQICPAILTIPYLDDVVVKLWPPIAQTMAEAGGVSNANAFVEDLENAVALESQAQDIPRLVRRDP
jgi:hypothetical protein